MVALCNPIPPFYILSTCYSKLKNILPVLPPATYTGGNMQLPIKQHVFSHEGEIDDSCIAGENVQTPHNTGCHYKVCLARAVALSTLVDNHLLNSLLNAALFWSS